MTPTDPPESLRESEEQVAISGDIDELIYYIEAGHAWRDWHQLHDKSLRMLIEEFG